MQTANQAKLGRIAILSLSFDGMLKTGVGAPPDPARTLDVMDLPQMIADRYGIHQVELQHAHFLSAEAAYLKDLRGRIAKAKSQLVQINMDFGGSNVSATGFSARAQGIDLAKQWIDHAEALGCPRVLVNQGSLVAEVRPKAIEGLKILADYGKAHKVTVTVENRDNGVASPAPAPPPPPAAPPADPAAAGRGRGGGGRGQGAPPPPPATWQVVVEVIKAVGISATPNIGNFPNETERAAGLRALFPLSGGTCHCTNDPAKYSLADAIKISKDVGYKGLYSIQAVGGADPHAATKLLLDELLKSL
jgi:hypothetical protein